MICESFFIKPSQKPFKRLLSRKIIPESVFRFKIDLQPIKDLIIYSPQRGNIAFITCIIIQDIKTQ